MPVRIKIKVEGSGVTPTGEVVALLLFGFGSGVVAVTEAVFVRVPPEFTRTTSAIVAEPPTLIVPRLQVTVVVPLQDPCEGVAETKDVLEGMVSVTVTPAELDGPALLTTI